MNRVLYMGDTSLTTAAAYLAGVMTHCGIQFDYVDSDTVCSDAQLESDYSVIILSDYLAKNFTDAQCERIIAKTRAGAGLLMIGGWESFTGLGGDYHKTPLADVLPVNMKGTDDRVNSFSPCMIGKKTEHATLEGLPFDSQSPAINGYNQFEAKAGAETLLTVKRYHVSTREGDFVFQAESVDPMLVVGAVGEGRVACYAGDVAPHWAGGFVDWGGARHAIQADGAGEVELGAWYIQFFGNIIRWLAKEI